MTVSTPARPRAILTLTNVQGREMGVVMEQVGAEAAAQALGFSAEILAQLRRYGVVAGDGDLIDLDDAARVVDELRAAQAPFAGKPILISKAATKYGFSRDTIYAWISAGWVKVLVPEPRRQTDEGDMVLAKELANRQGHIPGRAVFPPKPRPGSPRRK
jgi:hypothetical protein